MSILRPDSAGDGTELFDCLLVCGHRINPTTDLPWEFWCPTCKSVEKVQHNKLIARVEST